MTCIEITIKQSAAIDYAKECGEMLAELVDLIPEWAIERLEIVERLNKSLDKLSRAIVANRGQPDDR